MYCVVLIRVLVKLALPKSNIRYLVKHKNNKIKIIIIIISLTGKITYCVHEHALMCISNYNCIREPSLPKLYEPSRM